MPKHLQRYLTGAIAIALVAVASSAQNTNTAKPQAAGDAITFYSAGLEQVLPDPKDTVLVKAVRLIDQRLGELPRETGDQDMPAAALQFALSLLLGPMEFRAGLLDEPPAEDSPPIYAQWDFLTANLEQAQSLSGQFSGLLASKAHMPPHAIQPAPNLPGMQMVQTPGPLAYFGAMKLDSGSSFTLAMNQVNPAALKPESIATLPNAKPAFAVNINFQRLQPLFDMALMHGGDDPGVDVIKRQLQTMGFYGSDATIISAGIGHQKDRALGVARLANYKAALERSGFLPTQMISAADLKRIPADASFAQISKFNFAGLGHAIRNAAQAHEEGAIDPMQMVEQMTGINPQRDILDHLGQTIGFYSSDTTGGSGLLSLAAFVEVKNPEALNQTIAKVTAMLNQMAKQNAKGYVRIAERTVNNQAMRSLTFPGVPIPLEISFAMADGYLHVAASPQSLLAAIEQSRSGKTSLADNPRFKEMGGDTINGAMKMSFMDTPRLMRGGYGIVSLGMAALTNAVRSPTDSQRGSDLIMPSLGELSNGAKAMVSVTRIEGNDLVATCQMDRSALVNVCGIVGAWGGSPLSLATVGMLSGVTLPAIGKARQNARGVKSAAQLRQIGVAVQTYAAEFDGALPPSIDTLVERGYMSDDLLASPFETPDMLGDYFLNLSVKSLSDVKHPDKHMLGYDRAMLAETGRTAALFYDGHFELVEADDFKRAIEDPANAGVDFKLPG
jgi:hypothetical protein